jgi:hypothetical protein
VREGACGTCSKITQPAACRARGRDLPCLVCNRIVQFGIRFGVEVDSSCESHLRGLHCTYSSLISSSLFSVSASSDVEADVKLLAQLAIVLLLPPSLTQIVDLLLTNQAALASFHFLPLVLIFHPYLGHVQ